MSSADNAQKPPFSDDPKLNQLLEAFKTLLAELTPEERRIWDRENAINWVYGTLNLSGKRNISRETIAAEWDKRHPV